MKVRITLLGLCLGMAASIANAEKKPVSLACTTRDGDTVGMRLCSALRDEIATSPRYQEVSDGSDDLHWGLRIVTIPIDESKLSSAQSVTITVGGGAQYFVMDYVLITGADRVKNQAQVIIAALDEQVAAFANSK